MRFFGGLSVEETAEVLKVSAVTVMRDWSTARAWLYRELRPRDRAMDRSDGNKSIASYSRCWNIRPRSATAFLRHACAGDQALEREVRSLLTAQREAGEFLHRPAIEVAARALAQNKNEASHRNAGSHIGQTVSHYRVA